VLLKSLKQEDKAEGFLQWPGDDPRGFGMTETQHKCTFLNNLFKIGIIWNRIVLS